MQNKASKYYAFRRADQMVGHNFTDDVALCKAESFLKAKKIFSRYYADVKDDEIILVSGRVEPNSILILTDY